MFRRCATFQIIRYIVAHTYIQKFSSLLILVGQSIWPVQLAITSLPPAIRMDVDCLLLAGVWLGPVKPNMKLILEPIIDIINQIDIEINISGSTKHLKAKLLLGVFDLPAKAMALNTVQFNGKHGCPYCLDEGIHVSHRRLYLPNDTHEPRKMRNMIQWADQAEQLDKPVNGVKGHSVLSPHINLIKSVPVDYMHAVLEGVTKTLFNCWFDSKNHAYRFYLGRQVEDIDRALLRIKPPHEFRRTPRSIRSCKYWKASEYRAWLLFYSIPTLANYLPLDHLHHLSLLVTTMHILLGDKISSSDIKLAHLMLKRFYQLIPQLYPQRVCSANVHSLIHLCECVCRCGPLWCYSAFGFENMNGYIKKHCHGTRNVLPQLIQAVTLRQTLPTLHKKLSKCENEATMTFLEKVIDGHSHKMGPLGRVTHMKLSKEELEALDEGGFKVMGSTLPGFPRYKGNSVFVSSKPRNLRNSSICKIRLPSKECFGSIRKFCFVGTASVALVSVFESTGEDILKEPHHSSSLNTDDHKAAKCINSFIFKVKKISLSNKVVAVSLSSILTKCVHIPLKHSPTDFIVTIPNIVEHH